MEYFGRIIDAHAHIYPERIAEKATLAIGEFYSIPMAAIGTAKELVDAGAAVGVRRQLVCSMATSPAQVKSINDFIAASCKENGHFVGFGTMHPDFSDIEGEMKRIKSLGLLGIKLHTDFAQFYIDEERALAIYRAAVDTGLPILFHMGDTKRPFSEPSLLKRAMSEVKGMTAIASHFGGYRCWDSSARLLSGIEGLYFDTSSSLEYMSREQAAQMIDRLSEDNIFFGTDFPMWSHEGELKKFLALRLPDSTREKILYKNFERVFLQ